jgi:hypothetical protein
VSETRSEAAKDIAEERQEAQQEVAETQREASEKLAAQQRDVTEAEREVAEADRARAGEFAPTLGTTLVTGQLKESMGDEITLNTQSGEVKLDTDATTKVTYQGNDVKLDDYSEGTEVRASYSMKGDEKIAHEVEILKPAMKK